jgi:hypothetical protein
MLSYSCSLARTHTQNYSAYLRNAIVIDIFTIGVVTVKGFGQKKQGAGWSVKVTLIQLMWKIWWALYNASKWHLGFNSAFKGLMFGHGWGGDDDDDDDDDDEANDEVQLFISRVIHVVVWSCYIMESEVTVAGGQLANRADPMCVCTVLIGVFAHRRSLCFISVCTQRINTVYGNTSSHGPWCS